MKFAAFIVATLIAHTSFAACSRHQPAELAAMSNDALRSAYCASRTQLDVEASSNRDFLQTAGNQSDAATSAKRKDVLAGMHICYDDVSAMIAALEARHIDVDAAVKRCDAPVNASPAVHAEPATEHPKPAAVPPPAVTAQKKPVVATKPAAPKTTATKKKPVTKKPAAPVVAKHKNTKATKTTKHAPATP
jgi:hypothetical protein